ncbi:MAG: sigma-54-dependent Fis family transcriptional regulator [Candidatus Omnitrophica bacterium]|nr:sigma-54-dependent Fis family transcriptional regulator [Candidatus Omnitrophota bacterium]MCB9767365.1 sigma-54-dependent Fis family transcriptional regulator [Candidatus Omnitrophota bacterium]MCB9784895.1 sigma-54-dependent Fis family transcriptional regulator [Candidatus Omnitrophota bacterium]
MEETLEKNVLPRILIADDEDGIRFAMKETLAEEGYEIEEASDGQEAVDLFGPEKFDLVILDYRMPTLDGLETLKAIRRQDAEVPILFVTAYGSKDLAMEALREGAYDYFTKPFDVDEIRVVVRRALEKRTLRRRVQILSRHMDASLGFDQIIGSTTEMRDLFHLIQRVAGQDVTVLVLGESGTGKELVASAVHRHSKRRNKNFVAINCAAIPGELLESELFGHERGAFTGAHAQKIGKFEHANGGTMFLDEIGDMDSMLQAKMLRVLQDNEFQRVGGNKTVKVDVRIIAATNKDLSEEVAKGRFREDLFFRLNVIPLYIPPLRNRRADVPILIDHFVKQANTQYAKEVRGISKEVMEKFMNYNWPGNVRELENVITRAVILSHGEILSPADLPIDFSDEEMLRTSASSTVDFHSNESQNGSAHLTVPTPGGPLESALRDTASLIQAIETGTPMQDAIEQEIQKIEKGVILSALEKNRWRRGETANFLGVSRRNLLRKMQKLGIE